MRFASILMLLFFMFYVVFGGCAPPVWVKNLAEKGRKQEERKAISIAVFDLEGSGLSDDEKEQICQYFCLNLHKPGKVEVMNRNVMNLSLLKNGFPTVIKDDETAVAAGKLLKVDKVTTSLCGKIEETWMISVKLIDIHSAAIDTTISYEGSKDEILKKTTSTLAEILQKDIKDRKKEALWITLGAAIVGEVVAILLSKKAKEPPERELPRPSDFP